MIDSNILIVPDVHAGYEGRSRVDECAPQLAKRLKDLGNVHLVFIGDVFEFWRADPQIAINAAAPLCEVVRDFIESGDEHRRRISYIIGNHDYHLLLDPTLREQVNQLMGGAINFYHRYLLLEHGSKKVLAVHGDDYDFFYLALEEIDPFLFNALEPQHIYEFYEWVYHLDKGIIANFEKRDWRSLFVAWLVQNKPWFTADAEAGVMPGQVSHINEAQVLAKQISLLTDNFPVFGPPDSLDSTHPAAGSAAASNALRHFSLGDWISRFTSVSLQDIKVRTPAAQGWRIENYNPYDRQVEISSFQHFDHIVVGHFHDPRQSDELHVTDCGSWVSAPHNISGTHVEIREGYVFLFKDGQEWLRTAL